jgi:polyisoprenoid-binding protein YceI
MKCISFIEPLNIHKMKNMKFLFGAAVILLASAFTSYQLTTWKVKEDYYVKCRGGKGDGTSFRGLKAAILFDEEKPEKSYIRATIDATSLSAGSEKATEKAKADLETKKFPAITFESTSVKKTGPAKYEATGNFTLKGVTKEIKMPFHFDSKNTSQQFPFIFKETFQGTITIVPKDYNVQGFGDGEKLPVEISVPVIK